MDNQALINTAFKNIIQPDLRNLSFSLELPAQPLIQPLKENSTVVYAVSVPEVYRLCALRKNRLSCNHCSRFL
nr:MAG TPA: hypothetical protein [Caudoviricetes sp.]